MMNSRIFFTHQTARQFWIHRDLYETKATNCIPSDRDVPDALAIADATHYIIGQNEQVHVAVSNARSVRVISNVKQHVRTVPYPHGSFRRVSRDVYVACPELCFLQSAIALTPIQLVAYGYELCGTYACTPRDEETRYKREPLTNVAHIQDYLKKSEGASGIKNAHKAAKYLLDGSASPCESMIAIAMILPPHLGGFGLPKPYMNWGIEVNKPSKKTPWENLILHGDIVWPEARLVVEYDGKQHGFVDNHALDKQRDHLLLDAGYDVIRFTKERLHDPLELERLAATINLRAKLRRKKSSINLDFCKRALIDDLMAE